MTSVQISAFLMSAIMCYCGQGGFVVTFLALCLFQTFRDVAIVMTDLSAVFVVLPDGITTLREL